MTIDLFKTTPRTPEGALELVKEVFPDDRVAQDTIRIRVEWERIKRSYKQMRKAGINSETAREGLSRGYNMSPSTIDRILYRR